MKFKIASIISIAIISVILVYSVILLANTLVIDSLQNVLIHFDSFQSALILLISICLITLYISMDNLVLENQVRQILIHSYFNKSIVIRFLKIVQFALVLFQIVMGVLIPLVNILGFFDSNTNLELVLKTSLLLFNSYFVFNLINKDGFIKKILTNLKQEKGIIAFLDREGDHEKMSEILNNIEHGSEILVTHFEEQKSQLKEEGYYYEKEFMSQWYSNIRDKELKVKQIILINNENDVEDLKKRLDIIRDIKNFSLGYILAPPLTVFIDFIVFPNDVLIGFSDNKSMPSMNTFGLLIHKGQGVSKFKNMFNEILMSQANFVKTFEGVNKDELRLLEEKCERIKRYSKSSRAFFKVFT